METLPAAVPATSSGSDNKYLWAIGGLVLGVLIANYRNKNAMAATIQRARDEEWDRAHESVEQLLYQGEQRGMRPSQIAKYMKGEVGFY